MSRLTQLQEHFRMLTVEDRLLFEAGDWEALAQVRMALDDTFEEIMKLTREDV